MVSSNVSLIKYKMLRIFDQTGAALFIIMMLRLRDYHALLIAKREREGRLRVTETNYEVKPFIMLDYSRLILDYNRVLL